MGTRDKGVVLRVGRWGVGDGGGGRGGWGGDRLNPTLLLLLPIVLATLLPWAGCKARLFKKVELESFRGYSQLTGDIQTRDDAIAWAESGKGRVNHIDIREQQYSLRRAKRYERQRPLLPCLSDFLPCLSVLLCVSVLHALEILPCLNLPAVQAAIAGSGG